MNHSPVVLVTGANGGIGQAIVERIGLSGYHVVAGDLEPALRSSADATYIVLDVQDHDSVSRSLKVSSDLGTLCGIVNCAGVLRETPVDSDEGGAYDLMLSVNLTGTIRVTRLAASLLGPGASIVNISSIAASSGSARAGSGYAASKGGLEAYTRATACELGPRGIRVNAVAPGFIRAPMAGLLLAAPAGEERILKRVPLRRLGEPRDVAEVVEFLISGRSGYMTGTVVTVDGGVRAT